MAAPTSDADRWLDRPDARLRWRDGGEGPALLLLHGWALDLELFEPFVSLTRGRLRLLRFDRRGYGLSSGEPALPLDVDDALAVLDAAGVSRCAVLGMSQGARVAAGLARNAPGRITQVVLDGAPALRGLADEEHEPELPLEWFRRLAEDDPQGLIAALVAHPLLRLMRPSAQADALLLSQLRRYPAHDLQAGHAPPPPTFAKSQAAFAQPVLVINGALDSPARQRIGRRLATVLPDAARKIIANAGHLACLDDPRAYADAVLEFIVAA